MNDFLICLEEFQKMLSKSADKKAFSIKVEDLEAMTNQDMSVASENYLTFEKRVRDFGLTLIHFGDMLVVMPVPDIEEIPQLQRPEATSSMSLSVDDFVDGFYNKHNYARFFFLLHRLPAALQYDFANWIDQYKLFCRYQNQWYRVTGASRLGDIWLTDNFAQDTGYKLRVDVAECSDWSDSPPDGDASKQAIMEACDLYARLLCGQITELSTMFRFGKFGFTDRIDCDKLDRLDELLYAVKSIMFPGLPRDASYVINDKDNVSDKARAVYAFYKALETNDPVEAAMQKTKGAKHD